LLEERDHTPNDLKSNFATEPVSIPITYVPLRNTIFISLAAAYLESEVLHSIEERGLMPEAIDPVIYMAPNVIDYSGYPDCRPEFFEQIAATLELGSKLGAEYRIPIKIETPIIELSKADIVMMGIDLGAPLEHTWSCYLGGTEPCGKCDSCVLRADGFSRAGIEDPALRRT